MSGLSFLGADASAEAARCVVLPIPHGVARQGPHALLLASHRLERRDEETGVEIAGVHTAGPYCGPLDGWAGAVARHVRAGRFVVAIGGDAAISPGASAAHAGASVLRIGARAVAARKRLVQVGIREVGPDARDVKAFLMHRSRPFAKFIPKIIRSLTAKVYVSIELDGLDPSIMPGVAAPSPGGLEWYDLLDLLRAVPRIVGADVVGLTPIAGGTVSEIAAARLVAKIIAYAWKK